MKLLKLLAITLFIAILVNCAKKEDVKTYEQCEENGIRTTRNNGTPADSTFKIELKEVGIIDLNISKDSVSNFNSPSDYDMDEDGNIFIFDQRNSRIHKYDSIGKFILAFGGKGSGPGEFQRPGYMNIKRDTLYIPELASVSILKFDLNGKYLAKKQYKNMMDFPIRAFKFGENFISIGDGNKMNRSESGNPVSIYEVTMFDQNFNLKKNVFLLENEFILDSEYDPSAKGVKAVASDLDLFVYEYSKTDYKIDVYNLNGDKVRSIRKNYAKIKTSDEAKKRQEKSNKKRGSKYKTLFKNSISKINTDKYGRLWVRSSVKNKEEGSHYDIFQNDIFQRRIEIKQKEGEWIRYFGEKLISLSRNKNIITIYDY